MPNLTNDGIAWIQGRSRPAMKAALDYMRRGEPVPDSTVWDTVREDAAGLRSRGGLLFDGFPRTLALEESLKQLREVVKVWHSPPS